MTSFKFKDFRDDAGDPIPMPLHKDIVRSSVSHPPSTKKLGILGTSLVVQWLRLHASKAVGIGSIPGQGTKIPHAVQHGGKKKLKFLKGIFTLLLRCLKAPAMPMQVLTYLVATYLSKFKRLYYIIHS